MLAELSAHEAADYPPHWQPPPDRFPLVILRDPFLMRIMNALQAQEVSPWVERHYVERFNQSMRRLEDNTGGDIRSLRSELQRLGLGHLGTLRKRFGPAIYLPPGWEEDKGR
jgi:hypothetical protein